MKCKAPTVNQECTQTWHPACLSAGDLDILAERGIILGKGMCVSFLVKTLYFDTQAGNILSLTEASASAASTGLRLPSHL